MFRSLKFVAIALATLLVVEPAIAQYQTNNRAPRILRKLIPPVVRPDLSNLPNVQIPPSQAAAIAKADYPGAKVLKVNLRGGVYFVILVFGGNVIRVRVDATYGSIL